MISIFVLLYRNCLIKVGTENLEYKVSDEIVFLHRFRCAKLLKLLSNEQKSMTKSGDSCAV